MAHAFSNPKDWPCAQFSGLTVIAAAVGALENRGAPPLWSGVFLGLALACKMNAVFALTALLVWAPMAYLLLYRRRRPASVGMVAGALSIPYIGPPLLHLNGYVSFMPSNGSGERRWFTAYPVRAILFMTPPVVTATATAGGALWWLPRGLRRPGRDDNLPRLPQGHTCFQTASSRHWLTPEGTRNRSKSRSTHHL